MQQILSKPWLYGMLNPPGAASAALAPDAPWAGWRRGLVVGPGGGAWWWHCPQYGHGMSPGDAATGRESSQPTPVSCSPLVAGN